MSVSIANVNSLVAAELTTFGGISHYPNTHDQTNPREKQDPRIWDGDSKAHSTDHHISYLFFVTEDAPLGLDVAHGMTLTPE